MTRPRLRTRLGACRLRCFSAASTRDCASARRLEDALEGCPVRRTSSTFEIQGSPALVFPWSLWDGVARRGEDSVSPEGGSRSRASRASSGSTSASSGVRGSTRSILAPDVVAQDHLRSLDHGGPAARANGSACLRGFREPSALARIVAGRPPGTSAA